MILFRHTLPLLATLATTMSVAGEKFRFERPLMGTRFMIVCHADDRMAATKAAEAAFAIATNVNAIASDYLPDSELSQIAGKAANIPITLSPELYDMLDHSRRLAEATGGAFDPNQPDEVLTLANAAVSTSGDLHQSVEIDGVKYSHILDPATGMGLTRRIAASVIASEAKLSDPLATAACVLGPEAGDALRKLPGVREVKIRILQDSATSPLLRHPTR